MCGTRQLIPILAVHQHHAVRLLHKAVKKAKTFEVQKLTRKVKQTKCVWSVCSRRSMRPASSRARRTFCREPKDGKADEALGKDLDAQLTALKVDLDRAFGGAAAS